MTNTPKDRRTSIAPEILQPFLDSAVNAAIKGQSQFHTPTQWGQLLSQALPDNRPIIADLNCGNGALLRAASTKDTRQLLGLDIDPCPATSVHKIPFDLTLAAPLLREAGVHLPCVVLNPPWDLWWHRSRLEHLSTSPLPSVRDAFRKHDGRTTPESIDSTVASTLIALDLMHGSAPGWGMLIANHATMMRLIFDPGAPHTDIARHFYAHVVIPGNIMTKDKNHAFGEMSTSVLYFTPGHKSGIQHNITWGTDANIDTPPPAWRKFIEVKRWASDAHHPYHGSVEFDLDPWCAVAEECPIRLRNEPRPFNLWLTASGTIAVHLSLWDSCTGKVDMNQAKRLQDLHGKRPMQLVIGRTTRDELLAMCNMAHGSGEADESEESPFRCAPALQDAIRAAIRQYHSERSPLYPLPKNLRMGYLDEHDTILCLKDFAGRYTAGKRYRVESETIPVVRKGQRPGFDGDPETIEYSGQELAYDIADNNGIRARFMDPRLKSKDITVDGKPGHEAVQYTLIQLGDHFDIPEVPDVSITLKADYERYISTLRELEAALAE